MYVKILKPLLDAILSFLLLVILSPVFFVIIVLIKIVSRGPVFYASERIGKNLRSIRCWKFRSMYENSEQMLTTLLNQNMELKKEWDSYQKLRQDPRIHPIGRFLRASSFDELPQLFNVLMGDLSLVGPRPLLKEQLELYSLKDLEALLSIKPGITGLWQISGRSSLTFSQRQALESLYLQKQSFLFDIFILLKTFPAVVFRKGAC